MVISVLAQEQRAELVSAVQKKACDLAATRLTRARDAMTGSIVVDIAGVDAEVGLCNYGGLIDTLFTDVEGVA